MGNQDSKGGVGVKFESEEYWWLEAMKELAPVQSCEEFCRRFKGGLPSPQTSMI